MLIGAVADIHGNFDAMYRAMTRHTDVPLIHTATLADEKVDQMR